MHKFYSDVKEWRWNSVLVKGVYVGLLFIGWQVGVGKVTTLFLSWLNEYLKGFSLGTVLVLSIAVGIFMFLLPPVPGVPVYLAGGVIVTNAAWGVIGYWPAVGLASIICFGLKLVAVVLQQKGIDPGMHISYPLPGSTCTCVGSLLRQ